MLAVAAHRTGILHTRSPGTTGPPRTWQGNMRKMGEESEDTKVPACGTHRTGLGTHSNPAQQGTPQRGWQASTRGEDEGRRGDEERKHQLRPNKYKLGYDSWGSQNGFPDDVLPVFGSEPMLNLNRTRTGPHVQFGVQQILDFAEPSTVIVAVELMDDQTGQKILNVMYGCLSPHSRPNVLFC
ncbi:hypothetical protein B0H11DRAFT_2198953 [Mycena galericulata]|nr:hypothetical protein B0H11DRAFT_2198953 [Mycena galericulata]